MTKLGKLSIRDEKIGLLNYFINAAYSFKWMLFVRCFMSKLFHLELPRLKYPLRLPHPYGVIVNPKVIIGKNVTIYQHVTIGSKQFGNNMGIPQVEDDVVVYPNALIIGNIVIGAGSVVGGGSVVLDNVPPGTIVAGNPARVIKKL